MRSLFKTVRRNFVAGYALSLYVPDYFIMMSWYHHPKHAVRSIGPEGEYTMTRAALDFFNAISNRISAGAAEQIRK